MYDQCFGLGKFDVSIGLCSSVNSEIVFKVILHVPAGTVHNQVMRVRDADNKVTAHKWNSPEQRWEKQTVIGGPAMPKKTQFEGKVCIQAMTAGLIMGHQMIPCNEQ